MFMAVTVIDVCLNFTGLSTFVAVDILGFLLSLDLGGSGSVVFQFIALFVTMALAVLLGMGMPAVPAYINVALLMGPLLIGLGIATFTAHMFIFYFAVASAITPPVALAAFAASTITKADPMATGFSAVRSGIVMFIIPFVFAMYPELLLIDAPFRTRQQPAPPPTCPAMTGKSTPAHWPSCCPIDPLALHAGQRPRPPRFWPPVPVGSRPAIAAGSPRDARQYLDLWPQRTVRPRLGSRSITPEANLAPRASGPKPRITQVKVVLGPRPILSGAPLHLSLPLMAQV